MEALQIEFYQPYRAVVDLSQLGRGSDDRGFWHDPQRYLQTYWSGFPKTWLHGDRAAIDQADEALAEAFKERVVRSLGRPLKPEAIKFVADLPKTRNAKIMRRVIRGGYLGQEMGDLSALENPLAVDEIRRAS